jgi:hypothetical protein
MFKVVTDVLSSLKAQRSIAEECLNLVFLRWIFFLQILFDRIVDLCKIENSKKQNFFSRLFEVLVFLEHRSSFIIVRILFIIFYPVSITESLVVSR